MPLPLLDPPPPTLRLERSITPQFRRGMLLLRTQAHAGYVAIRPGACAYLQFPGPRGHGGSYVCHCTNENAQVRARLGLQAPLTGRRGNLEDGSNTDCLRAACAPTMKAAPPRPATSRSQATLTTCQGTSLLQPGRRTPNKHQACDGRILSILHDGQAPMRRLMFDERRIRDFQNLTFLSSTITIRSSPCSWLCVLANARQRDYTACAPGTLHAPVGAILSRKCPSLQLDLCKDEMS